MTSSQVVTESNNWDIQLGKSIGPFQLGQTLSEVIYVLKKRVPMKGFDIIYSEKFPIENDIFIRVPQDTIQFRFDFVTQQLKLIDIYELGQSCLSYERNVFSSNNIQATFIKIYKLFGPTYPGNYDVTAQTYTLEYKGGISLTFPIPQEYEALYQCGDNLPLEFPDGSTPILKRLILFSGESAMKPSIPAASQTYYFQTVCVGIDDKISIFFTKQNANICLGQTLQSVISQIGRPVSSFEESKSILDSKSKKYYHNYPHLGLDIMYESQQHTSTKIILHTNFPGHPEFNSYLKCNFKLTIRGKEKDLTPDMKWSEIKKVFEKDDIRPIVHDSGSYSHPFGSTRYYCPLPGLLFEVMRNGFIASVQIEKKL